MRTRGDPLNKAAMIAAAGHVWPFGWIIQGYIALEQVWTKGGGTYRFPSLPDLDEYVTDILLTALDRIVWVTDWPRSAGMEANPEGDRNMVQVCRNVDDTAFITRGRKWYQDVEGGTGELLDRKFWVENPKKLWQWD
ncbi:hypothetical protein BDV27DRAFT_135751, partial [Aspergillus caelatus]